MSRASRVLFAIITGTVACHGEKVMGLRIEEAPAPIAAATSDSLGPNPAAFAPCEGSYSRIRVRWRRDVLPDIPIEVSLPPDATLNRQEKDGTIVRSHRRADSTDLALLYSPDTRVRYFGASFFPREMRRDEGGCRIRVLGEDGVLWLHVEAPPEARDSFYFAVTVVVKENYHRFAAVAIARSRATRDSILSALLDARTTALPARR